MRRYWRERQPTRMFRGAELPRLMSGILMLAILYLLYGWMRDASTWRWLVNDGGNRAESKQIASPKAPQPSSDRTPGAVSPRLLPAATGPTDEDPDQAEEARNEFQVMVDGSLQIQREEQEVYDRLVEWVKNQSFDRLYQRARKGVWYTDLYDAPDRHRGELVALDLEVRRAKSVGENRYGVELYEVWGLTEESRGRMHDVIVVDYPKAMPVGHNIYAKAKFAGYFLKLQGYENGGAKPGQAPDKAPLLIGRLEWEPTPVAAPPVDSAQEWTWGLSLLAVIGLALGLRFVYYRWIRRKPAARAMIPDAATGEVIPIDAWLERSGFGAEDDGLDGGRGEGR